MRPHFYSRSTVQTAGVMCVTAARQSRHIRAPSVLIRRQPSTRHLDRSINIRLIHQWDSDCMCYVCCVARALMSHLPISTDFAVFNYRICMALNKVVKTVHYFWVCHQMRQHRTPLVFQLRCRIRSWTISVSYRDRLRAKNRHVGISWKWCTRSNTIRNACNMDCWKVTLCCLCSICHRASIDANSLLILTRHTIIRPRLLFTHSQLTTSQAAVVFELAVFGILNDVGVCLVNCTDRILCLKTGKPTC